MIRASGTTVIGYDLGPQGDDAVALAEVLTGLTGTTPLVATVLTWPSHLIGAKELAQEVERHTASAFAAVRDRFRPVEVECRTIFDRAPARGLQQLAEEEGAVMIVAGSSHRGPVGRTLLGSVGTDLLQGAPCAVAIAPKGLAARPRHQLQRIGVAFDGTPEAWGALETAIGLSERVHGALTILTVAEPPRYGYADSLSILGAEGLRSAEVADKERLLDLAYGRVPAGLEASGTVLRGPPAQSLAAACDDLDLMVCGSRGYGPLRRTLLGSTSRGLTANASCPVIILARGISLDPLGVTGERAAAWAVQGSNL